MSISSSMLHESVIENNVEAVRFFLMNGADPNNRQLCAAEISEQAFKAHIIDDGYLNTSVGKGSSLQKLRNKTFPNVSAKFGKQQQGYHLKTLTPMHTAAANGSKEILELLIRFGGDVNSEMAGHFTPLVLAILYQHPELIHILIKNGANVNWKSITGKSPLHFACKTKQHDIVELLLFNYADPNTKTNKGVIPLHIAVNEKLTDTVELLLKFKSDVNVDTISGITPLDIAIVKGLSKITERLLYYGGDVSVIMKNGELNVPMSLSITDTERNKIIDVVKEYAARRKKTGFYGKFIKQFFCAFHFGW